MSAFINTNIASLNAQRNLNTSQSQLTTSLQRLSSGLRINSAKDDAAGLAIASRFTSQIRGTDQAVRNANDGISLAQTAEGSLGEITNNLQRIRELAVQASNSTNSSSDRAAIDQEVQQRLSEIDRNASQTSFNGQKILDGSFGSANFQVGANAGETISISLSGSMRTSAIGAVATTTTTGSIGATASGGNIGVTSSSLLFGTAAAPATSGSVTISAGTRLFAGGASAQVDGTNTGVAATAFAFDTVGSAARAASFTTAGAITPTDFTTSGINAHFDITDNTGGVSTTFLIALDGKNFSGAGGLAAMATEITNQLSLAGSNTVASIGTGPNAGKLILTAGETGASSVQPTLSNVGSAISGAGIVAAGAGTVTGADAVTTTNASFTVDGAAVSLTGTYTNRAGVASAIQTQLGSAYAVSADAGGALTIKHTGFTNAVAVAGLDTNEATLTGLSNSGGTAGSAAVATKNATLSIGGTAVTLNQDYASYDAMATAIGTAMGSSYTVANNNGAITVSRTTTGATSTAVAITGADAQATAAGFGNAAGTAGQALVATTNASFQVDGHQVNLTADYLTQDALAAAIQGQLAGYTAVNNSGTIKITNSTAGSAAVAITGADAKATAAGIVNATGSAGSTAGAVTLNDFSITSSTGNAISMNGTYASADDLAAAINKSVSGVYASTSGGKLTLNSSSDMNLSGANVAALGFASGNVKAINGSLNSANTKTAAEALSTVQRVDSALASVSTLRSTFGAIQNRFESVIANLSSSSENMSAARSRIQDADFAAETASLTRGQILQQAGTAMLAQANSLPNGVMALLRG